MVHLGPLTPAELDCAACPLRESRGACGPGCTPEPWVVDHQVHLFTQSESRLGLPTEQGERWKECQRTGKVMVVCTCGYSSGLIDRTELTSTLRSLAGDHPGSGF